ncbi:DNA polymerase III subunit beta [Caminibacter pacificus]
MHIKIDKPVIESIINQALPFTEKKDNTQITSHILLKADDKLTIKATDKEIGIEIKTDANILNPGTVTINGKRFADIIKTLQNKEIEIKNEGDSIIITQDTSIYKLSSFNAQEFPEFPNPDDLIKLEIKPEEFTDAIKKIFPVIDTNNPKYELNGALFDISENTNFVSTDTRRLAVFYSEAKSKEAQIIVPKRAISEIKRIYKEDMEILFDEVYLILKDENTLFFTKLINGKFPAYKKIIPQSFKHELKVNKSDFLSHLKQVSIISNEVKITIKKDAIEFESISDEMMQAKTSMNFSSDIEEFTFAVNSRYVFDFLNVINSENFDLCLNEPNIPFVLRDGNFITIVMPLNI